MSALSALSEQQVLTLYVIGTVLTVFPVILIAVALLGFMQRQAKTEA